MKNIILILLLAVAIVFGGKFFVEKRYESKLDDVIAMAMPFVAMRYDKVKLDFDGSLSLLGFQLTPPEATQSIDVARITLKSSDRFAALKGDKLFANGRYPESLSINIDDLSFDTSLMEHFNPDAKNPNTHCRAFDSTFNYAELSLSRITSDMSVSFNLSDPFNATFSVYSADQAMTFDLDGTFDMNGFALTLGGGGQPELKEVNFTSEITPRFADEFIGYCAKKFDVTNDVFLQRVIGSPKYSQNSFGADLGPEFRQALMKYFAGDSRITVNSKPSKQLQNFKNAKFFKAKDVVRWLNMSITSEGEPIAIDVSELVRQAEEAEAAKTGEKKRKREFQTVSVAKISSYRDQKIRLFRSGDRTSVEGRLLGIEESIASVEIYRHNGFMTYTVPVSEITKFQVFQ